MNIRLERDTKIQAVGALCIALLAPGPVRADTPVAQPPPKRDGALDTVVVHGAPVRASEVASDGQVQVLGSPELTRFGQVPLGEALSRNGAIVITTGRNGNTEITLSGLGDGYTQILLNGSKVPRGFSLDTLSADNVERVEIVRSPNVEAGARGIAGTINIVMKKVPSADRTLGFKATSSTGWNDGRMIDGTYSRSGDATSVLLQASDRRNRTDRSTHSRIDETSAGTTRRYDERAEGPASAHDQNLVPKWEWHGFGKTLVLEGLYQRSRQDRVTDTDRLRLDAPAAALSGETASRISRDTWSTTATYRDDDWLGGRQLETRLTLGANERVSEGIVRDDSLPVGAQFRRVEYPSYSRTRGGRVKFKPKASAIGQFAFGLQYDHTDRDESQTIVGATRVHDAYAIGIADAAAFAQWDRKTAAGSSLQAGLRAEQVALDYDEGATASSRTFTFLAPQASWSKKVGKDGANLSFALGRAIRIPDEADFSNRTYLSVFNSAANPDQRGNPDLRPETATTAELGWSRPKGARTELRASLSYKRLDHVITQELLRDAGAWVMRPTNIGAGELWMTDLNLRRPFAFDESRRLKGSLSVSLTANASSVRLADGERTRLSTAVPYQASVGLDFQGGNAWSWTAGAQWTFRPGFGYRLPGGVRSFDSAKRTLDLQASLRFSKAWALRLSMTNLLQRSRTSVYDSDFGGDTTHAVSRIRDGATVRIGLEWTL